MMQFCDTIIKREECFSPKSFCGENIKQFYILFESQFTRIGQILFTVYEFLKVSPILGHPVHKG